ncbi:MAG: P-type conjugative transfer protein TrbL, partial [Rhodospirillales bacterium]|nr:P-type conjugative transfer protein TrbL [Acetobacter sp.]
MKLRNALLVGVGCMIAVLIVTDPARAQTVNVLDGVVSDFQTRSAGWEATLRGFATTTFGILALIELGWAGIRLAFRGADVGEWLAEVVTQIMFLGFFYALLQNSVTWSQAIINSFRQAAGAAGGVGISPSDVFASGVKLAVQVLSNITIWHPGASAALMIAGLVIEACFALMAAAMVLALVESYLIISSGVIFMAFGGSRWTKDIAISTVRYAVSVGAKLFTLQLLISIGMGIIQSWANSFNDVTDASLCILIGCSIVMLALVTVLPATMQRMISGASMASSSALVGAAAGVSAGVTAVGVGMIGAGPMVGNAFKLASAQMQAADAKAAETHGGIPPERSRVGRAAAVTGGAAKNLALAPLRDVGRRLTGDNSARHGNPVWRMSADMANRQRLLT